MAFLRMATILYILLVGMAIFDKDKNQWGFLVNLIFGILPGVIIYSIFFLVKKLNRKYILVFDKVIFLTIIVLYILWGVCAFVIS